MRVPSDLAYWNERFASALHEFLDAKIARERVLGELLCDPILRDELDEHIGKKATVEQLKGWVMRDDRYLAAKMREMGAEVEKHRLRGCVEAIAAKRDMLISLGAHVRLEMMHDPVLRQRMAALRDIDVSDDD